MSHDVVGPQRMQKYAQAFRATSDNTNGTDSLQFS
jgi:hypothetical protein